MRENDILLEHQVSTVLIKFRSSLFFSVVAGQIALRESCWNSNVLATKFITVSYTHIETTKLQYIRKSCVKSNVFKRPI